MNIHSIFERDSIDAAWVQSVLEEGDGPLAFVGRTDVELKEWAAEECVADVSVVLSADALQDLGPSDLITRLWNGFPRVAVLLHPNLAELGAVILSESGRRTLIDGVRDNSDPLGSAIAHAIGRGISFSLNDVVGTPSAEPSRSPAQLVPNEVTRRSRDFGRVMDKVTPEQILPEIVSPPDAQAVMAGLLLWHDLLHESHTYSQLIEGKGRHSAGDYWHAIMHRREPDYGNSKYWFRRVGSHPIHRELAELCHPILEGTDYASICPDPTSRWDAAAFVEACQDAERAGGVGDVMALRQCQEVEMLLLLEQSCHDASGV